MPLIVTISQSQIVKLDDALKRFNIDAEIKSPTIPVWKRSGKDRRPTPRPESLVPGYAFLCGDYRAAAKIPTCRFSPMIYQGKWAFISDEEVDRLARYSAFEWQKIKRQTEPVPKYPVGASVRVTEGPFEGLTMQVQAQKGRRVYVEKEGLPLRFSLDPFILNIVEA